MPTVLITGANRGIGLEFARQYRDEGWEVIATCRSPESATELKELGVEIDRLDVGNGEDVLELARRLSGRSIDLLVNNAGIYGDRESQSFGSVDAEEWLRVLRVNVVGPLKVAEAFLPHLEKSGGGTIACISSKMGSIADNTSGGSYIYRSSKAALNMVVRGMGRDLAERGIVVLALHPGWVRTRMGGPSALITPAQSVEGMRQVIAGAGAERSGGFFSYDGQEIPW